VYNASVPRPRSLFGVHPALEDALAAVPEDDLPEDIDAILPAQRRMSSDELVAIGRLCAAHVHGRVGKRNRAEFERLTSLVDRFLAMPRGGDHVRTCWDLATAARRDAEHARGPLKIAALAAYAASESGVGASRLVGDAARLAVKTLAKDRGALHAFLRELCTRFR
jgi:hypothetical protein